MTTADDLTQALDEAQSWQFLTEHRIGRLAIVIGGEPDIFPVNYVVDGRSIVFRTAEGSKMLAVALGGRMAFQVDEWDHTGAVSVLAHGTARELGPGEIPPVEQFGLTPWVATLKVHWVRLEVDEIAGRAFTFGPEPEDFHPLG